MRECWWGNRVLALLLLEQHASVPIRPAYYYKRNVWSPSPYCQLPPPSAVLKDSLSCPSQLANAIHNVLVPLPVVDLQDFSITVLAACSIDDLKEQEARCIGNLRPELNNPHAAKYNRRW